MARGLLPEPAASAASPSRSSEKLSSDKPIGGLLHPALRLLLAAAAEAAYQQHRLRYVHTEDDGQFTYVCVCDEGFVDRRQWNAHITESFSEVINDSAECARCHAMLPDDKAFSDHTEKEHPGYLA